MDFRLKDYLSAPYKLYKINKWMKKAPTLPKDDMDKKTLENLKEICKYANDHIPFYKEWFKKADFDPELMDSFEYFERLPILDKETVRNNIDKMVSDEAEKLGAVICETSGSTGTPLKFYLDRNVNAASFILFYRTWSMSKEWNIFKKQATISGYAEGEWRYSFATRILYISSFHLNDEMVKKFYKLIKKYNVKFIRGYPSSLYLFAKLLEKNNLKLQFNTIFSGAETLLPYQREFIEKSFNAKVIDHYTHWERTASICECMDGKLHAQNDYGYHEIVSEDNKSIKTGVGRLVCTGLYNKAMPLIRYDTRDLAKWSNESDCTCGCNFPIIESIIGRIEDVVVTPEGNLVGRLDAAFKFNDNIKLAYIYQPTINKIIVNICPDDNFNMDVERPLLENELRKRIGKTCNIEYKIITEKEIPYTPRGKVRFVISDVDKSSYIQ